MSNRSLALFALLLASPAAAQPKRPAPAPTTAPTTAPATPTAAPAAEEPAPAPAGDADVDALRQEYLQLRDRLFRSRARAAAVESAMYSSRMRIALGFGSARLQAVTRAAIRLDGASVYDDVEGDVAKGSAPRFDGFVAPGRHLVSIRIEATSKDDERFATATESTFVVVVPQGKDVVVTAKAKDDGDLGYAWKKEGRGELQLRLDVTIESKARAGGGKASARREGGPRGVLRAAR